MGGGDLNMKKSWHPLLQVNQERVWKREQAASEERKKLEELRREREQEREMQELQRLQEEAGGKKRVDKVDWMYATPAANAGPSSSEMEDYLLGTKRVDKLFKADDAPKVSKNDQTNFISLQNANTSRDLAAKVREDPMLAIKQQEQAAFEALLRDPARLRQMKRKAGIDSDSANSTGDERRRRKEDRRRGRADRDSKIRPDRASNADERSTQQHRYNAGAASLLHDEHDGNYTSSRRRSDQDCNNRRKDHGRRRDSSGEWTRGLDRSRTRDTPADRTQHSKHTRGYSPSRKIADERFDWSAKRADSPGFQPETSHSDRIVSRPKEKQGKAKEDEAKLREMTQNARSMHKQRTSYVSRINAEEADQERQEAQLRQKLIQSRQKGLSDGKGTFLLDQQRKAFEHGVDLADRLKRGRGGYQNFEQ